MHHQIAVSAQWFSTRGQYVADVERHGGAWYSDDGDSWTYLDGRPVKGPIFEAVAIRLEGGPRDGQMAS